MWTFRRGGWASRSTPSLGRRIKETPAGGSTRDLYYSDQWQLLEERVGGVTTTRYAWRPVYVDAMIVRQHDADADGTIAYEERLYALQDANYNVTGLFDMTNGWPAVIERFIYDPYGSVTVLDANWATDTDGVSDVGWANLHQGLRYDKGTGLYDNRRRPYDADLGRFPTQDPNPAGVYADGLNLYQYVSSRPIMYVDSQGLSSAPPTVGAAPTGCPGGAAAAEPAYSAWADGIARTLYPGSRSSPKQNAMRHCLRACQMSLDCGQPATKAALDAREKFYIDWSKPCDTQRDRHNNSVGMRSAALQAAARQHEVDEMAGLLRTPTSSLAGSACVSACKDQLSRGLLNTKPCVPSCKPQ